SCPREGTGLDLFPGRDRFGPGDTVREAALQFRALRRGKGFRLGLADDTVPEGFGNGDTVFKAEPVEAEFEESGGHDDLAKRILCWYRNSFRAGKPVWSRPCPETPDRSVTCTPSTRTAWSCATRATRKPR